MSDGEAAISNSVESRATAILAECWKTMAVINETRVKPEGNFGITRDVRDSSPVRYNLY